MKERVLDWLFALLIATPIIGLLWWGAYFIIKAEEGTEGHRCYPNDTCDKGLVCYPIGDGRCELPGLQPKRVP